MSTEKSPTLPQEYVKQAAIALQIHHGISHLRTVNPAILTILSTSRSVRAVLLAGDMLLSRMGHAFIAGGDKTANFPLELAAFYVDGRALGAGEKVDANKIRTEVRALNAEQFESDPETAKKWIEALEEAESIVAKIQGEVGRILDESTKTNIIQFVARYGDSTAEKLVGFIETNRGRDAMTQRSEAFIFVKNLIGTDRTVAALPTSARIVLAMSMVELCRVHKFDIMNHYVQGKSAPAFVDDMRKKQIAEFEDGLKKG